MLLTNQSSCFSRTASPGLIVTRLIPLLTQQDELNGFILSLEDVSQLGEAGRHQYRQLDSFVKMVQAALAEIQANVEQMKQAPSMEAAQRSRLQEAITAQTVRLKAELEQAAAAYVADLKLFDWRMAETLGTDLLWAIQRAATEKLDIATTTDSPSQSVWLRVDSASIVLVMAHILRRLKDEFGLEQAMLRLTPLEQLAAVELGWPGKKVDLELVRPWLEETFSASITVEPVSVAQVAEAHGGQI